MQTLPLLAPEGWVELFAGADRVLRHLELWDQYAVDTEDERYRRWRETGHYPVVENAFWAAAGSAVRRGVVMERARVVSRPVSEYIVFEHAATVQNLKFGERVRWLWRQDASELLLPGNDFWLVDDRRVMFNLFDGDGRPTAVQVTEDRRVVQACAAAFAAVWERGVNHADFVI